MPATATNVPGTPTPGKLSSTPADAGPTMRHALLALVFRATAPRSRAGPTRSVTRAWRAGTLKAKAVPCPSPTATRCHGASRSATESAASTAAHTPSTAWDASRTLCRGRRSATTPPTSAKSSNGTPRARLISPSMVAVPVIWNAA